MVSDKEKVRLWQHVLIYQLIFIGHKIDLSLLSKTSMFKDVQLTQQLLRKMLLKWETNLNYPDLLVVPDDYGFPPNQYINIFCISNNIIFYFWKTTCVLSFHVVSERGGEVHALLLLKLDHLKALLLWEEGKTWSTLPVD
jgi:hypothetical protein